MSLQVSIVKDKYRMIPLICGILKNGTNEPIYRTEIESQIQKTVIKGQMKVKVLVAQYLLFVTPWTVARKAPLSMGFSR